MRKPKIFENQNNSLLYRFLTFPGKDSNTVRHQALLAHRIISSSARVTFLISLVVTLCFYPHIPAETGVHFIGLGFMPEIHGFSENIHRILYEYQEIDVIAAKVWLFYPYAITGLILLAGMLLPRLAGRLNNKRFSENTKSILIDGLKLTLDIVGLVYTLYFCGVWTVQILRQQPMRVLFTFLFVILTILAFMDMVLFTVMLYADERKKHKNDSSSNTKN